ncbi:MAG: dTMP kinase [Deltaproteobacteria bacterium]|nr:dTMP kinase [Deltaproteobacteria bacterium]
MFITFEGIEGCGKTTQIKLLAERLKQQGYDVVLTREPGGPPISEKIRHILVDAANKEMVPTCELLLYFAARAQHLEELIKPNLKKGRIVLCDRFVDASVAYQGYARGLSLKDLAWLSRYVLRDFKIDLTLVLDLPVKEGLQRARGRAQKLTKAKREDRFENEKIAFHEAVRKGYLALAKKNQRRFVVVDAALSKDALHDKIYHIVSAQICV